MEMFSQNFEDLMKNLRISRTYLLKILLQKSMMLNMQEGFGLAFNVLVKNSEYLSRKVFHLIKNSVYHFLVNILEFHEDIHRLHY